MTNVENRGYDEGIRRREQSNCSCEKNFYAAVDVGKGGLHFTREKWRSD